MITLLTDFGTRDPFAGILKGVIAGINPEADVVDLTHEIPPQDIRRAALVLGDSYRHFPKGTIFLCVIDPGVGTPRRPLCVQAGEHFFIGPDNGTFTVPIIEHPTATRAWEITSSKYLLPIRGGTFHGLDIFAPAAAWLSRDIEPWELGPESTEAPVLIDIPKPDRRGGVITGEVVMIDRFGNAITNIRASDIKGMEITAVAVRDKSLSLVAHYAAASGAAAVLNSEGRVEIFVCMGSAEGVLGVAVGDVVTVSSAGAA